MFKLFIYSQYLIDFRNVWKFCLPRSIIDKSYETFSLNQIIKKTFHNNICIYFTVNYHIHIYFLNKYFTAPGTLDTSAVLSLSEYYYRREHRARSSPSISYFLRFTRESLQVPRSMDKVTATIPQWRIFSLLL